MKAALVVKPVRLTQLPQPGQRREIAGRRSRIIAATSPALPMVHVVERGKPVRAGGIEVPSDRAIVRGRHQYNVVAPAPHGMHRRKQHALRGPRKGCKLLVRRIEIGEVKVARRHIVDEALLDPRRDIVSQHVTLLEGLGNPDAQPESAALLPRACVKHLPDTPHETRHDGLARARGLSGEAVLPADEVELQSVHVEPADDLLHQAEAPVAHLLEGEVEGPGELLEPPLGMLFEESSR